MRSALHSSEVWVLATEGDRLFQCGIAGWGEGDSSGHHYMSGIYDIEHYVMTWYLLNCGQGSCTCLFQYTLLHNESCEKEAGRTDP